MVIIVEFLVVSYLLYTLTKSVYQSYQIDQHIENFRLENDAIAQENKQKEADYSYYSSDAYIEKIAKQNLGFVNPGEEVIVIPNSPGAGALVSGDQNKEISNLSFQALANPQRWWKFFFDINRYKK